MLPLEETGSQSTMLLSFMLFAVTLSKITFTNYILLRKKSRGVMKITHIFRDMNYEAFSSTFRLREMLGVPADSEV